MLRGCALCSLLVLSVHLMKLHLMKLAVSDIQPLEEGSAATNGWKAAICTDLPPSAIWRRSAALGRLSMAVTGGDKLVDVVMSSVKCRAYQSVTQIDQKRES